MPQPDTAAASPVLTSEMFDRLAGYGEAIDVAVDQVLYDPSFAQPSLVAIESGQASLWSTPVDGGHRELIAQRGPGEFIGELGLLTGQRPFVAVVMNSPGRVHRVDAPGLRRLMSRESELSDVILQAFLARRRLLNASAAARSVEIIGNVGDAATLALRTYAARQRLAHVWLDAESAAGRERLSDRGLSQTDLPVVLTSQGTLRGATPNELGARLGLVLSGDLSRRVDLAVIGGGPAGLAATIYGASEGLTTTLLDAVSLGGQAAASSRIENYLGFPSGISGGDLAAGAAVQALKFGANLASPCRVAEIDSDLEGHRLKLEDGTRIEARAVVIASGVRYRALRLPRWPEFEGAGIFYAATAIEARSCEGGRVVVVGGANSAGQAALFMASRGAHATLVVRSGDLRIGMSAYLAQRIVADSRIAVLTSSEVVALHGTGHLAGVTVRSHDVEHELVTAALFCFIGARPATSWLTDIVLDGDGFVRTDVDLGPDVMAGEPWQTLRRTPLRYESSRPGVFAAGDVRHDSMKRVAAAAGEGAAAIASVHRALATVRHRS